MNEAIVYTDDDVSANWETLLRDIHNDDRRHQLNLSDSKADLYDFSDELRMQVMRERLLEALENWADPNKCYLVRFGNKFFATMSAQQQRSFFRAIFAVPFTYLVVGDATFDETEKPAITICTAALLDALIDLSPYARWLSVENFALSNQSEVEALSNIILAKRETLRWIFLKHIECPIDYYNKHKRDEDGPVGFLDPLLYAASHLERLHCCELSARTPPSHSSLVSPKAVRALSGEQRELNSLRLHGLGLNDSHCHVIADELRTPDTYLDTLNLCWNPAISAQGYSALLGLINRVNVVESFLVDDKRWEAKLNLVSEMNHQHYRLEYMTDGAFTSEEHRWQWLQKLASLRRCNDTQQINFIWYELLEHPEFMQT